MARLFAKSTLILALVAASASADIVKLTNGSTLEGDVKKNPDGGWVVIGSTGKMTNVRADEVASMQMSPSTKPAAVMERLASLRRAVDNSSDMAAIIDRYQKFIDQAPDEATKKAAQDDLATWKQRKDQGLVKFGSQWIPAGDKAKVQEQAFTLASQGRDYIKQGRLKEADPLLQQAIALDPGCATAHYLRGLLMFRQDQTAPARKEYEATLALVPDHVPTLNNLAIAMHKQNQIPAALNQYDRAMVVAPNDRWVLTNVAEVLESLPPDMRKNEIVKRAQKRFDDQIVQLEAKLANEGLYRWGATWVTAADLDKLKAAEAKITAQRNALAVDFDALQAELTRINASISDNLATQRRMEAESVRYDANGTLIRIPYPAVYYEIQRDTQRLTAERAQNITKMEQIRVQAKQLEGKLPTARFTGSQQVIGVEGAPVLAIANAPGVVAPPAVADVPATQPTTIPSTQPAQ